jgi:hypothetical protein
LIGFSPWRSPGDGLIRIDGYRETRAAIFGRDTSAGGNKRLGLDREKTTAAQREIAKGEESQRGKTTMKDKETTRRMPSPYCRAYLIFLVAMKFYKSPLREVFDKFKIGAFVPSSSRKQQPHFNISTHFLLPPYLDKRNTKRNTTPDGDCLSYDPSSVICTLC